jgi:Condensation domain
MSQLALEWIRNSIKRVDLFPVLANQERVLLARELAARESIRFTPNIIRVGLDFRGGLDEGALGLALRAVFRRHIGLTAKFGLAPDLNDATFEGKLKTFRRTGIFRPGIFIQSVSSECDVPLRWLDISTLPDVEQKFAIEEFLAEDDRHGFDYGLPPLARATVIRCSKDHTLVILTVDHIVCDGRSMRILRSSLADAYSAHQSHNQSSIGVVDGYVELATAQREHFLSGKFSREVAFWNEHWQTFCDARLALDEFPWADQSAVHQTRRFERVEREFSPQDADRLRVAAHESNVSSYMLFLGTLLWLLHDRTGRNRLAVWAHLANRVRPEVRRVVSYLVNTHLIGVDLVHDSTMVEVLHSVREAVLSACRHQDMPLPLLWASTRRHPKSVDSGLLLDFRDTQEWTIRAADGVEISEATLPDSSSSRWANIGVYVHRRGPSTKITVQYDDGVMNSTGASRLLDELVECSLGLQSRKVRPRETLGKKMIERDTPKELFLIVGHDQL